MLCGMTLVMNEPLSYVRGRGKLINDVAVFLLFVFFQMNANLENITQFHPYEFKIDVPYCVNNPV